MKSKKPMQKSLISIVLLAAFLLCGNVFADEKGNQEQRSSSNKSENKGKISLMTLMPNLTPVSDYRGDIWTRSTLFGDVAGKRQELYENGVAIDFAVTQYAQGVVHGGKDIGWHYGGSADYYLFLDSGRLNLWPGGLVGFHLESKFGRSVIPSAGVISPVNTDYLWPSPGEKNETFLSEYYLYQGLTDRMAMLVGRVNWVGVADKNRFANSEKNQFLNMGLRNTLLLGSFFPLTAHGVALAIQPNEHIAILPFIVSANDEPGKYGSPGGIFSEITGGAEVDFFWKFRDLPGAARSGFAYGTKDPADLSNDFLVKDAILGGTVPSKSGNWILNLNFDQYLYMPEQKVAGPSTADFDFNPEGIGVFFRFAYTPEDRNLWNIFVSGGIGGRGLIPGRHNDRYGLGFYSLIESDDLKDQPILGGKLGTEWGMEMFYNIAITPWLQFTPDLQYISSGLPGVSEALVLGTRLQIYF